MSALANCTTDELMKMAAVTAGKQGSYREATADDIAWLIESWTDAAVRCRQAGVDAIEIHCAHGYMLGGFLARADNQRSDEYGGSLADRARLACEVIASVKAAVGDTMAVIVRVAGLEFGQEGGLTNAEACAASTMFEKAGPTPSTSPAGAEIRSPTSPMGRCRTRSARMWSSPPRSANMSRSR